MNDEYLRMSFHLRSSRVEMQISESFSNFDMDFWRDLFLLPEKKDLVVQESFVDLFELLACQSAAEIDPSNLSPDCRTETVDFHRHIYPNNF